MPERRVRETKLSRSPRAPATTPAERENQLISLAVDLTERQLLDGTASAQVITHYLKLGSSREKLEQLRLQGEVSLLDIKRETMQSQQRIESLYEDAISAMRQYGGHAPAEPEDDYED